MRNSIILFLILVSACQPSSKNEPSSYYDLSEQDRILSRIIAHIYTSPPYVSMQDRLRPEYSNYYLSLTPKFSWLKLHINNSGTHHFLVERPGVGSNNRVVAGSFEMNDGSLTNFKEVFVTPALPDSVLKSRSEFLFNEWMNGNLQPYLKMATYVQWPNEGSLYDTLTFEWRLKPEVTQDVR